MAQPALIDRLHAHRTTIFPTEKEWIQFVKDHRDQILENSNHIFIDFNDQNTYRYRLYSYLVDTNNDPELLWIVLWLNQLDTEMDFDRVTELYLPSVAHLLTLWQSYRSFRAKFNKEA